MTKLVTPGLVHQTPEGYTLDDPVRVVEFLDRHPDISGLLQRARHHLEQVWGPGAEVTLHYQNSPDDEDDDGLVARVQCACSESDAIRKLAQFNECWWHNVWRPVFGRLTFDVERRNVV